MPVIKGNNEKGYALKVSAFEGGNLSASGAYLYDFYYFSSKIPSFCKTLRYKS